jgi:hypothetical protein
MFMWMLHNKTIISKCLCECYIKWDDNSNTEMFMWMLHNEMIMEKCSCECYIIRW